VFDGLVPLATQQAGGEACGATRTGAGGPEEDLLRVPRHQGRLPWNRCNWRACLSSVCSLLEPLQLACLLQLCLCSLTCGRAMLRSSLGSAATRVPCQALCVLC